MCVPRGAQACIKSLRPLGDTEPREDDACRM